MDIHDEWIKRRNRAISMKNSNNNRGRTLHKEPSMTRHLHLLPESGIVHNNRIDSSLRNIYHSNINTERYKNYHQERRQLPIYSRRDEIIQSVISNQVTIICGATGRYISLR